MLLDPRLCFAVVARVIFASTAARIPRLQAEPRFDAPRAQLWRLVIRGLFDESPVLASIAVALGAVVVFGVPMFLAWDFAKGAGRRKWVWVTIAVLASWLVVLILWIASSRSGGGEVGGGR
jgi:hypothetical protein